MTGESEAVVEYVVGFALSGEHVALIEKNRPAWQAGRLNGIGGHVEPGEDSLNAMRREFREETGVMVHDWDLFVTMDFPGARIRFYRARVSEALLWSLRTTTDEQVTVQTIDMPTPDWWLPNLLWLVPLAAYTADTYEPIHVQAAMAEVLS